MDESVSQNWNLAPLGRQTRGRLLRSSSIFDSLKQSFNDSFSATNSLGSMSLPCPLRPDDLFMVNDGLLILKLPLRGN